ncbi:ArsR/SmtB family transcription factor [Dietzia timorensis]|uniref:ArsR/SmtB family transcription factor n=1 Tax=Dietzia timorensis TaxID=499555 RepID=UPI00096A76F8|nr:metalloregulator ArsR/SmtB family transcription factor [Dietzia timorensis]
MSNNEVFEPSPPAVSGDLLAALFHALAESTRLAVLEHLSNGELRVRDLVEHINLAQSTVSKHLSCLRNCGLVTVRAEGRASWFSIADEERLGTLLASADCLLVNSRVSLSLREHQLHSNQQDATGVEP